MKLNQVKRLFLGFLCLILWALPFAAQASPFLVENGKVYGHRGPEGTVTLFAKAIGGNWELSINKVFTQEGKLYYFLSAELEDRKVQKNQLTNVVLTVNGKNVPLQLLEGLKPTFDGRNYQGYYAVPEDLIQLMTKAEQLSIAFQFEGASPETGNVKDTTVKAIRNLLPMEKERYVREGKVLEATDDPTNEVFHPQLFIPGAKAEDIMNALIYETNFYTSKGKEEFDYSGGYLVYHTTDPQMVVLSCRNGLSSGTDYVTVICRPYNNGVWVTMNLLVVSYSPGYYSGNIYHPGSTSYAPYENAPSSGIISTSGYWRTQSRLWAMRLRSVYQQLYGKADFGFTWEVKDVKRGPFKLLTVDSQKFPELDGIKAGDLLTSIDGVSTTLMTSEDIQSWMDNNGFGGPKTLSFKTAAGEEKKITLTPQVQLTAPENKKDYAKTLAEKMPKWFTQKDIIKVSDSKATVNRFDPLSKGMQ